MKKEKAIATSAAEIADAVQTDDWKTPSRRKRWMLPVALLAVLAMVVLFPTPAYAAAPGFDLFDIGTSLKNWVCYILAEGCCGLLNAYSGIIAAITNNGFLSGAFNSLLGTTAYSLTETIYETAIVPIASGILALFMLVQLVKISQRMDATATMPAIKDLIFLAAFYMIFSWLISNGFELLSSIYDIVANDIIPTITATATGEDIGLYSSFSTEAITQTQWDEMSLGNPIVGFIACLFTLVLGAVAYVVSIVVVWARAWQLYALAAFSAIPFALLGFEETRQMGIGFLKNFVSAALATAIVVFILMLYPTIVNDFVLNGITDFADQGILALLEGSIIDGLTVALKWLASAVLLIAALLKSGSWANAILGS